MKQFKRMSLVLLAASFVTTAWGKSSPPKFDINKLDEEQRHAFIYSLMPYEMGPYLERNRGEYITFSQDITLQNGESPGAEVIVGEINCVIAAHDPHISAQSGTIKSKASGTCQLIQVGEPFPEPSQVEWTLFLAMGRVVWWKLIPEIVAYGDFPKIGLMVDWPQDATGNSPGTQVDLGTCMNGKYVSSAVVTLEVSPPWQVLPTPIVAYDWSNERKITQCPN